MSDTHEHTKLQGWVADLSTVEELKAAFDKAFEYRGDITLTLKSGQKVEGYVFDRRCEGARLEDCCVRLFPKDSDEKLSVPYSEVAGVDFSGRDMAAGRSFELWMKKYREKKARGEKGIRLEPEPLE